MPSLQELLAMQPESGAAATNNPAVLQRLLNDAARNQPQQPGWRRPWDFSRWSGPQPPQLDNVLTRDLGAPLPPRGPDEYPPIGQPARIGLPSSAPFHSTEQTPGAGSYLTGNRSLLEHLTGTPSSAAGVAQAVTAGFDRADRRRANALAAALAGGLSSAEAQAQVDAAIPAPQRPGSNPVYPPEMAPPAPTEEPGLPLPPPPTPDVPPPGSGAGGTDPIETALRGLMAGGAGGGGGAGAGGGGGGGGNYPSLASIPRPDSNAILAQYDQARPQTQAANTDEMHMAGLLGALAGIQMRPGQRLGFGLQGAMAGGAEGYSNERQRQRQDLRMDEREQRQHAAGRASLQAQLEGQDYTRQTDVQRFDQANRFHQESQSTARAGIAASAANAAATRQMQGLGLMIRLQQLRQSGAVQNLDLDMGAAASMLAPRISGSAGASQRLALPGGLRLSYNGENNLGVSQVETAAGRRFDDMVKNSPELRLQTMSAGGAQLRTQFIQRQIEDSFMGTLGTLAQQAQTDPIAAQRLQEWQDFTRRQTIIARSHRQATGLVSGTGNLD